MNLMRLPGELYQRISRRAKEARELQHLKSMTDRELADIGLTRNQIYDAFFKGRK